MIKMPENFFFTGKVDHHHQRLGNTDQSVFTVSYLCSHLSLYSTLKFYSQELNLVTSLSIKIMVCV